MRSDECECICVCVLYFVFEVVQKIWFLLLLKKDLVLSVEFDYHVLMLQKVCVCVDLVQSISQT